MSLLSALSVFSGLMLHVSLSPLHYCVPRKTVPYRKELKLFREDGIFNYSSMLLREELGLLLLGAREAVFALDMDDVSVRTSEVYWRVSEEKQRECTYKGKHAETECRNYIRNLHLVNDSVIYVCGTNAFSPTCDYMTFVSGELRLQGKQEEGKGKCPFDPFQRYSSIMVGSDLYSATSINFLGSEPVVLRSSDVALRTEFKSSWLSEPNFISMDVVEESEGSAEGDDDKVYLFFSENAMEYDFHSKVGVSRVARVCKGDMGGQRTLQRKWTSFVKAALDCSLPEPSLPYIVQDVFLLRHQDWRRSVFYAVFTPQSSVSQLSAVCAYSVSSIRDVFNQGKFKTPVAVETSHVKWVMYTGEVPVPRPGACVDDLARHMGMNRSLDLPDKTLQFIRDRPLMDEAVRPLTGRPLLVKRGAALTRVVVDTVQALDGHTHAVMFIGTEDGFIQKAVNYEGKMFIIEEIQLFEKSQPINILRLSSARGQLYAGSQCGVVQMPVSNCSQYRSCTDCVLARDPYCAWNVSAASCASVRTLAPPPSAPGEAPPPPAAALQSLTEGDVSHCPQPDPVEPVDVPLVPQNNIQLPCRPGSNLARVSWRLDGRSLGPDHRHYVYGGGLLLLNATESDAGVYACLSVEEVWDKSYTTTVAVFHLRSEHGAVSTSGPPPEITTPQPLDTTGSGTGSGAGTGSGPDQDNDENPPSTGTQSEGGGATGLKVGVALLSLLCLALMGVIACMWGGGRGRCLRWGPALQGRGEAKGQAAPCDYMHIRNRASEPLELGPRPLVNNHHAAVVDFKGNGEHLFAPRTNVSSLDGLGYINDESEI